MALQRPCSQLVAVPPTSAQRRNPEGGHFPPTVISPNPPGHLTNTGLGDEGGLNLCKPLQCQVSSPGNTRSGALTLDPLSWRWGPSISKNCPVHPDWPEGTPLAFSSRLRINWEAARGCEAALGLARNPQALSEQSSSFWLPLSSPRSSLSLLEETCQLQQTNRKVGKGLQIFKLQVAKADRRAY